ncbi:hypothetical protein [Mesorhizobium sp. WSM4884]|uniref:hypothetical protein n=1 Tax=Mesorhizobium sp. WSM4884 TaxID=3038542 RepID=UPI0024169F26|nr:hypothetical protein [Mesorhizobium sp. WSM4884]MDG4884090.1 hypothetical protein [Mesorhizobium sp. WSM4884]
METLGPTELRLMQGLAHWYDDVAAGVDLLLTVQSADLQAQTIVAAHGYAFNAEAGSDDGIPVGYRHQSQ